MFKVVSADHSGRLQAKLYNSLQDLSKDHDVIGIHCKDYTREELQGQPKLAGLLGPMYDEDPEGNFIARYESQPAYSILSRGN